MNYRIENSPNGVVLATTLAIVISLSALPGYSLNHLSQPLSNNTQVTPQAEGLDVTPVLDTERAVSQLILKEGGTITATGADGTRFTLEIPPDALAESEVIRVTPVSSVSDLPFSGGMAAVQLQPEGLVLRQPSILTIEAPTPVPVEEEAPFAWDGAGSDFHLYPLQADPSKAAMPLVHFSGYGLGRSTSGERLAQQQRGTKKYRSGLEQKLQKQTGDERLRRKQSGTTKKQNKKFRNKLRDLISSEFQDIRTQLESALQSGDEASLGCSLKKALDLFYDDALLVPLTGGPVDVSAEEASLLDSIFKAIKMLSDKAYDRCVKDHRPEDALKLVGLAQEADNLATSGHTEFFGLVDETYKRAEGCAQFELHFDSVITVTVTDVSTSESSHVKANVPIDFVLLRRATGDAQLQYVSFEALVIRPCTTTVTKFRPKENEPFAVIKLLFNLNLDSDCADSGSSASSKSPVLTMTINPPRTEESFTIFCPGPPPFSRVVDHVDQGFWRGIFNVFHIDDATNEGVVIPKWERGSTASVVAMSVFDRSKGDGVVTEKTTLELVHKPK